MPRKGCISCRWAKWTLTRDGRRNPRWAGKCLWPYSRPILPEFIWRALVRDYRALREAEPGRPIDSNSLNSPYSTNVIWHDDGKDCAVYERGKAEGTR